MQIAYINWLLLKNLNILNDHIFFIIITFIVILSYILINNLILFNKIENQKKFILEYLKELDKLIQEQKSGRGEDPSKDKNFLNKIVILHRLYLKKILEQQLYVEYVEDFGCVLAEAEDLKLMGLKSDSNCTAITNEIILRKVFH